MGVIKTKNVNFIETVEWWFHGLESKGNWKILIIGYKLAVIR